MTLLLVACPGSPVHHRGTFIAPDRSARAVVSANSLKQPLRLMSKIGHSDFGCQTQVWPATPPL